jgi:hypothetical protein
VWRIGERCQQLKEPAVIHNDQRREDLQLHLTTDLFIFAAFYCEINDRHLPSLLFPRSAKAIACSLQEIDDAAAMVNCMLGNVGTLQ